MMDDDQVQKPQEGSYFSAFGIYFCGDCKNMMTPFRANGLILQFKCKVCDNKEVDFSNSHDKDCMLYSKQLHAGSRKSVADVNFIFDPTMPRIKIMCPQCENSQEAIYFLTPDQGQRKIVVKLICASATETTAKCEHTWNLSQTDFLYKEIIKQGINRI